MSSGESIRPSQFILTYGTGSIILTQRGPKVVMDYNFWTLLHNLGLQKDLFDDEISDQNARILLDGGRIFRFPSNSDFGLPDEPSLIKCLGLFPKWGLCGEHHILYRFNDTGISQCPSCRAPRNYSQHEAIRFVRACPHGHMDDIDWPREIHKHHPSCKGMLFDWEEGGSALEDTIITCRMDNCGDHATLQDVYRNSSSWTCSGFFPERNDRELCDQIASVVLLTASNLRIPDVITSLTIPPFSTAISRILRDKKIFPIIAAEPPSYAWTKQKLLDKLTTAAPILGINRITVTEVANTEEGELLSAIGEIRKPPEEDLDQEKIKKLEFQQLQYAATHGKVTEYFAVHKEKVRIFPISSTINLRVSPVERLHVVMAQKGYRRSVGDDPLNVRIVRRFYSDYNDKWYPGIELSGEGIFIELAQGSQLVLDDEVGLAWSKEATEKQISNYDPTFIWWHTFAHRIITALGVDSGYSSAAIRERIFLNKSNTASQGGVLLFTAQQGGDGSLGGLVALVPQFARVLSVALRDIDDCSNDPLCSEEKFSHGKVSGAACYACLLLSETSCENMNLYLDRNLLRKLH